MTYSRRYTYPAIMGSGKNRPKRVIDGDRVMHYVGVGWVDEGPATEADKRKYPKLVEG